MSDQAFSSFGFYAYLNEHKLMGCRCQECGELHVPPRQVCSQCHGRDMTWTEMSGRGRLKAFTVITVAPTIMIEAGYGRDRPYCTGIVELEEGPSISGQILGVDVSRPESIRVGAAVRATFIQDPDKPDLRTRLGFEA